MVILHSFPYKLVRPVLLSRAHLHIGDLFMSVNTRFVVDCPVLLLVKDSVFLLVLYLRNRMIETEYVMVLYSVHISIAGHTAQKIETCGHIRQR